MKRIVIYGPEDPTTRQLERALREGDESLPVGVVIVGEIGGTLPDELYPEPGDVVVFTTMMYQDVMAYAQGNGNVVLGTIYDGAAHSPAFEAPK